MFGSDRETSSGGVLSTLNPSQRQAVTAPEGPLLVLAGAGSGKTRAIAHRIAFLISERRVPPWTILALTFTNKAAAEMRSRVASLAGEAAPDLWVYTFHALSLRLLRRFGTDIGLPAEFTIFDEEDRRTILRRVIREMGFLEREYPVWRVASAVSARKNAAFSTESHQKWQNRRDREVLEEIVKRYQKALEDGKGLDFDDLLIRAVELMECSERARAFAEKRFQHVLVDEYQDTNRIQYRLLRLLAPHGNLFVVGDEDQSIYNFRGADLRNILDFERDFPQARLVKLEHNYRSTGAILEAAGALIAHNQERKGKRLIPQLAGGGRPFLYGASDDRHEASYVADRVEELRRRSDACRVAVLVRTHAQTRPFEEQFIGRQIPHVLVGGQRFYERKEIKDALAYLRLLANPHDDQSFRRVVNVPPRGVGPASVAIVQAVASEKRISLWDAALLLVDEGSLSARAHAGLGAFRGVRDSLAAKSNRLPPARLVAETVEKTGLARAYQKESPVQLQSREENLSQLAAAAYDYEQRDPEPSLGGFLDQVSLFTDIDTVKSEAPCLLMTIHSAKGLEFDAVFLTGLEEGLFPHFRSSGSERAVEEERRLCYVGMTRAKESLFLTYAQARRSALEKENRKPSRFLTEIPSDLLQGDPASTLSPLQLEATPGPAMLRPGTVVRHPFFGEGTVVEAGPGGADQKITVQFRSAGRKKLIPRYAELQILGQSRRPSRRWR